MPNTNADGKKVVIRPPDDPDECRYCHRVFPNKVFQHEALCEMRPKKDSKGLLAAKQNRIKLGKEPKG